MDVILLTIMILIAVICVAAAAFYFGQDFLVHYPSENMVVVGNEFDI